MNSTSRNKLVLSVFLVLVALCMAASAYAQTTAVLGVGGRGTTGYHDTVTEILRDSVENAPGLELVDRRDLSTEDAFGLLGCGEPNEDCMTELAATFEVERILCGAIVGADGDYSLQVWYFDATAGDYLLDQVNPFQTEEDKTIVELRLAAVVTGRTVLRVVSDREHVAIEVDEVDYGDAPVVVYDLPPGRHVIAASCDGCKEITRIAQVSSGRLYTESLTPPDAEGDTGEPVVTGDGSPYTLPIVTLSLGGVLLATGTVFGVLTGSTQDDFDTTPDFDEALELADKGETYALLTNVFLISGAAITVTGALLLLTAGGDDEPRQASTTPTAAPWFGPSSGGVTLDWTF